jgi:hypothetical protein
MQSNRIPARNYRKQATLALAESSRLLFDYREDNNAQVTTDLCHRYLRERVK